LIAILTNEPARVGADLAHRALTAERDRLPAESRRPWFSYATWFAQATGSLLWAERYDELRPLLDESIGRAPATGDSGRLAIGLALRAWLALRLGDLAAAEADARTALAAAELRAPALYRVLNGGVLVNALVEQGELDAADAALAAFDGEIESEYLAAAVLRFGRGRLRIAQGQIDDGLADLLGVGQLTTRALVTSPSYLPWRSETALAYLQLGNRDAAKALADQELELARAFEAPHALGVALRAAALVAGGQPGEALLRESVTMLQQAGARLDLARSVTELGALVLRANRRTEARELLRHALDTAYRLGARPLAKRAEIELRATGARPRRIVLTGLESLTASERRVAELAAQNLTNREIAQGLFVTARTVEGHLTSVFRNSASRRETSSRPPSPATLRSSRNSGSEDRGVAPVRRGLRAHHDAPPRPERSSNHARTPGPRAARIRDPVDAQRGDTGRDSRGPERRETDDAAHADTGASAPGDRRDVCDRSGIGDGGVERQGHDRDQKGDPERRGHRCGRGDRAPPPHRRSDHPRGHHLERHPCVRPGRVHEDRRRGRGWRRPPPRRRCQWSLHRLRGHHPQRRARRGRPHRWCRGETFLGGPGDDEVDGNQGIDEAFLGSGGDNFTWDPAMAATRSKVSLETTRSSSTVRVGTRASTPLRTGSGFASSATRGTSSWTSTAPSASISVPSAVRTPRS
jgi:DNA-binding CsgD family transcriptional regulator